MDEILEKIKSSDIIHALQDLNTPFPPRLLRGFSDLNRKDLMSIESTWPGLPATRKVGLLEDLEDLVDHDTLVNFDDFSKFVIEDLDPAVRVMAIRLLWDCEDVKIVSGMVTLMRDDIDEAVRAAAAGQLGKFVLLGELDTIPDDTRIAIVRNLLEVVKSDDLPQVRQRALESLGYSSHPSVPDLIEKAYHSKEIPWIACALCAMGRSADEKWADMVESKINSPEPEIQFEAIRAAGDLELTSTRDALLALLENEIEDDEIRAATIWALSQIGGTEVKEKLDELLESAVDEDEVDFIEKAFENLGFSGSPDGLNLLDFGPEEDELDEDIDDLDLEDELDSD